MEKGIYLILNKENNKAYIGSSINIKVRWQDHRDKLRRGVHRSPHLQAAWNKYGKDSFIFSILECCEESDFIERESRWIKAYKSIEEEFGYNLIMPDNYMDCRGGFIGHRLRKTIIVINKDTREKLEYSSLQEFANILEIDREAIRRAAAFWEEGKKGYKHTKGWIVVYKDSYNPEFDYIKAITKEKVPKVWKKNKEDIIPYDQRNIKRLKIRALNKETGEEIVYLKGLRPMCAEYGFSHTIVVRCLKAPFKQKSHHGWWFEKII